MTGFRLAEEACLYCRKAPKQKATGHFCSRACATAAENNSPAILEVPEGHATFKSGRFWVASIISLFSWRLWEVAEQFKVSWRHKNKSCPAVRRVYKVMGTKASLDKYEAYRYVLDHDLYTINTNITTETKSKHTGSSHKRTAVQGTRIDVGMELEENVHWGTMEIQVSAPQRAAPFVVSWRLLLIWLSSKRRRAGGGWRSFNFVRET